MGWEPPCLQPCSQHCPRAGHSLREASSINPAKDRAHNIRGHPKLGLPPAMTNQLSVLLTVLTLGTSGGHFRGICRCRVHGLAPWGTQPSVIYGVSQLDKGSVTLTQTGTQENRKVSFHLHCHSRLCSWSSDGESFKAFNDKQPAAAALQW